MIGWKNEGLDEILQCVAASTMVGYSMVLNHTVVIAITCKRWGCRFCGQKKMAVLGHKTVNAKPTTLITLTVNNRLHSTPRAAWEKTRRQIPKLIQRIRRNFGEFEYLKILEITKKGWPHYHFVARCEYIPQPRLSAWWNDLTGAPIVDVRKVKRTTDAYFYVVKYLGKQRYIPWTNRRASMSKHFDLDERPEKVDRLCLEVVEYFSDHPADYLRWHHEGRQVEMISPIVYRVL